MAENESQKLCFVVGPIGGTGTPTRRHADWLLHEIIEPVFEKNHPEFYVERADKISSPGMIDSQLITMILDCDLVIADMSLLNPNAFYEIGIRHVIQKPIIHMFLDGTEIPFDVKLHRAIPFKLDDPSDLKVAREELRKAISEVVSVGYVVENPVTRARGRVEFEQHATPQMVILKEAIDDLSKRIGNIEASSRGIGSLTSLKPMGLLEAFARPTVDLIIYTDKDYEKKAISAEVKRILGAFNIEHANSALRSNFIAISIYIDGVSADKIQFLLETINKVTGVIHVDVVGQDK